MKILPVLMIAGVVLCIVCSHVASTQFAHNQRSTRPAEVNFRLHGIGLGSSRALVLRRLGSPLSMRSEKIEDDTCGPPHISLKLTYEGALFELSGDLPGRNFEVVSIEVTSPRVLIAPGIKIGMTEKEIRSKLGAPWQVSDESGVRILNYVTRGNDGGAALNFLNGRLVKVQWQYTLC